jgi:endonuclease/exonuclease/phosphatase family metal-dependent hydrolase
MSKAIECFLVIAASLALCRPSESPDAPASTGSTKSSQPSNACSAGEISVATLNTGCLNEVRIPPFRDERVVQQERQLLAELSDVDVVGFQESYEPNAHDLQNDIDHRESLRRALAGEFTDAGSAPGLPDKTGLMVFFRTREFEHHDTRWHPLPPSNPVWPRGLLCVDLEHRVSASRYRVCTLHFSPLGLLEHQREAQVKTVNAWARDRAGPFAFAGTVVLAGDFNLAPTFEWRSQQRPQHVEMYRRDQERYAALLTTLGSEATTTGHSLTRSNPVWAASPWDRDEPDRRVDLIFVLDGLASKSAVFLDEPPLSDHLGVRTCVSAS